MAFPGYEFDDVDQDERVQWILWSNIRKYVWLIQEIDDFSFDGSSRKRTRFVMPLLITCAVTKMLIKQNFYCTWDQIFSNSIYLTKIQDNVRDETFPFLIKNYQLSNYSTICGLALAPCFLTQWVFMLPLRLNRRPQTLHWKGFSLVWTRRCRSRWEGAVNTLKQYSQVCMVDPRNWRLFLWWFI
jgi:hypothetical protein